MLLRGASGVCGLKLDYVLTTGNEAFQRSLPYEYMYEYGVFVTGTNHDNA